MSVNLLLADLHKFVGYSGGIEHVFGQSHFAFAGAQNLLRVGTDTSEFEQRDQSCEKEQDHHAEKTH